MSDKIEKAIDKLLGDKGYSWCEFCGMWDETNLFDAFHAHQTPK